MKFQLLIIISFIYLTGCKKNPTNSGFEFYPYFDYKSGAIVRGDTSLKELSLVFTGDKYADGGKHILSVLRKHKVHGSFFLTGNFYRNPKFKNLIQTIRSDGHYLGAHSDKHLLYCDWGKRDSLLVTKEQFKKDLINNYKILEDFGISKKDAPFFLPPYEWYNDTISSWTKSLGLQLINITYGTYSHADYTTPNMPNYKNSKVIYDSITNFEKEHTNGLNGFILLIHIGTSNERTDKFYNHSGYLITELKSLGYQFKRIDELLNSKTNK